MLITQNITINTTAKLLSRCRVYFDGTLPLGVADAWFTWTGYGLSLSLFWIKSNGNRPLLYKATDCHLQLRGEEYGFPVKAAL
ncbi:MAG: hypothetical protein K9K64_09150, partial [Desulfohalobiaceae bacterium]|nr:hypothetical protein [Desulfohalobiaceae bacterium]